MAASWQFPFRLPHRAVPGALMACALALQACAGGSAGPAPQTRAPALAPPVAAGQLGAVPAPVDAQRGLVLAPERQAARAGAQVLAAGGNAADAAAATGLALAVTETDRAGFGGGGLCLYRRAAGDTWSISFLPRRSHAGHVAVPATLRGLGVLQGRFGQLDWAQTVLPAEAVARRAAAARGERSDPVVALLALIRGRGPQTLNTGPGAVALAEAAEARQISLTVTELAALPVTVERAASRGFGSVNLRLPSGKAAGSGRLAARVAETLAVPGAPARLSLPLPAGAEDPLAQATPSTGFLAFDRSGGVAACAVTMVSPVTDDLRLSEYGVTLARAPGAPVRDPLEERWALLNEAREAEYDRGERGALDRALVETADLAPKPEDGGAKLAPAFLLPVVGFDGAALRIGVAAGSPQHLADAVAAALGAPGPDGPPFFAGPWLRCGGEGLGRGECAAAGTAYIAAPAAR